MPSTLTRLRTPTRSSAFDSLFLTAISSHLDSDRKPSIPRWRRPARSAREGFGPSGAADGAVQCARAGGLSAGLAMCHSHSGVRLRVGSGFNRMLTV